jgi:uncharacterized repeat protein (TIGR03803 family)
MPVKRWRSIALLVAACGSVARAQGPTVTALYEFAGSAGNGGAPASLVAHNGSLYGTQLGGSQGAGAAFQLAPPKQPGGAWTDTVLYSFSVNAGVGIGSALSVDTNGALYGFTTAFSSGSPCPNIYRLTPPATQGGAWEHTVLYQFSANTDNVCPYDVAVTFHNGALYGVLSGPYPNGMVFELAPPAGSPAGGGAPWVLTVLYAFASSGFIGAEVAPIFDAAGNIYGAGENDVFELTPPAAPGGTWSLTVLYAFAGDAGVNSLAFGPGGSLFGGTYHGGTGVCNDGCGVVFELAPPEEEGGTWAFTTLYSFTGVDNEEYPQVMAFGANGAVYGATNAGANLGLRSVSTLFELVPDGSAWSFSADAQYNDSWVEGVVNGPDGSLIIALFDTFNGSVVQLSPPASGDGFWDQSMVFDFGAHADGSDPAPNLTFDTEGNIYGTTLYGGSTGACVGDTLFPSCGAVFKVSPPESADEPWTEIVLHRFSGEDGGGVPESGVTLGPNGILYGTTSHGGTLNEGVVFSLAPPSEPGGSWTEKVIYSFGGPGQGVFPVGPLVFDSAGALYGTTSYGGTENPGTVFKLTPSADSWTISALYSFTGGANGPYPIGVAFHNGSLYGVATAQSGDGLVFQLTPPTSGSGLWTEATLHTFQGKEGLFPYGTLVFDDTGAIYGTTAEGGLPVGCQRGCGIVFQLVPPATQGGAWAENILFEFTGVEEGLSGENPTGVTFDNGILYGTTCSGRLYQLAPPASGSGAWQHTALANFTQAEGMCPQGLFLRDGVMYGTASGSALSNLDALGGTVYAVKP